jgi:hypothetical protein
MRTAARTGGFVALLAAVLGGAWAVGAAARPAHPGSPAATVTLATRTAELARGVPGDYTFALTGPVDGPPRLTVVRRDAAVLGHAVPAAGPDGLWHAPLTLPEPGPYRVVVAVTAGGVPRDLAADLVVPGPFVPQPPTPSRVAEVDGYQVRLDGDLVPGTPGQVFATVSRGGAPVTDLEPVDGAFGRLDAVRTGDLALARIRPDAVPPAPQDRAGPGTAFTAEVPTAGTYRLFLGFRHGGALRTAVFTVPTG